VLTSSLLIAYLAGIELLLRPETEKAMGDAHGLKSMSKRLNGSYKAAGRPAA
jgi:hypothetical protein